MITAARKCQLRKQVAAFARIVLAQTADSCENAASSVANDEEDEYARECLRALADKIRPSVLVDDTELYQVRRKG